MSRRPKWWIAVLLYAQTYGAEAQGPVYRQRLELPVQRDNIGYGQAVTADPHTGEVFICDPRSNRILIFDPAGFFKFQILGGDSFSGPRDLAVDPEGLLLVLANRRAGRALLELDFDGRYRGEVLSPDELPARRPPLLVSLAISPDGERVYLADDANQRLWITDRQGTVLSEVDLAQDYDDRQLRNLMLGQVDVYGDSVLLAIMSHGEVLRLTLAGERLGFVGRKGTSRCLLGRPSSAALTSDGELLVIDQQRMLLLRWAIEGNRCLGEYLGVGFSPGYLYYPYDIALDAHGQLYIAQSFDGRVQVFEGLSSAAGASTPSEP